ncbi:MAG: PilN domain-containing protein [Nitrospirota bacterium]
MQRVTHILLRHRGRRPRSNPFRINLSSRFRWYAKPARLGLIVLVVVAAAATVWDLGQIWTAHGEANDIAVALQRVREQDRAFVAESAKEGIDLSDAALQRLPGEVALANQLLEKRVFSWTRFLTELEQAIPSRLAINSIRLDPNSSIIRLNGAAFSLEDVTALAVALQDHPTFKDPVLGQHRDAGNGLVEFDLTLRYRPQRM